MQDRVRPLKNIDNSKISNILREELKIKKYDICLSIFSTQNVALTDDYSVSHQ